MPTKMSQEKIADKLFITRDSYAKYETGKASPPIDVLLAISKFYHVSTDLLLTVDLRKYKLEEMIKLQDNRILLPIKTDQAGENRIEIIPYKASMGYLSGYADPEYIDGLQTMSIPFLRNGKFRAFPVEGDSMPPYMDGTFIIGEYVENITDLKIGKTHILVTSTGITFKRIESVTSSFIIVKADNSFYDNYEVPLSDLWEIWQYAGSFSSQEQQITEDTDQNIKWMLVKLTEEVNALRKSLGK